MDKHDSLKQSEHSLVLISELNKGKAGVILVDLVNNPVKIIVKHHQAIGVLLSPALYCELIDTLEDCELGVIALERLNDGDQKTYTHEEILKSFGIKESDLESLPEDDVLS